MLVDYTNIVAFNDAGFAWRTDRLSWDGVTIEMITENEIHGRGWTSLLTSSQENTPVGRRQGRTESRDYRGPGLELVRSTTFLETLPIALGSDVVRARL